MNTEKQAKIELALSKLSIEEQELLGLVKKPKKNHKLKINYMIGDADGHTDSEATISLKNPFLDIVVKALDKLGSIPGHWGIMLDDEHYDKNLIAGHISEFECELLSLVSGYCYSEDTAEDFFKKHGFENSDENHDYLMEFEGLFLAETEYSFLVYKGYKLK